MGEPDFLYTRDGRSIAYRRAAAQASMPGGARSGIVFLPGFRSDMEGGKALFLDDWARARGRGFLRFDYTGHGRSSGAFEDGCVSDWLRDARDALTGLTEGPQVLVGSSMGGWIALLLMREMPERVAGVVGIAAAPDFIEDLLVPQMMPDERDMLRRTGRASRPSEYEMDHVITRRMIEDGRRNLVLRTPLAAPCPVRLLHGTADASVPVETAIRLVRHIDGDDVRAILLKDGEHRLSDPQELALLAETVHGLPDQVAP